ncbi:hypothetical protein ScPMuIL_009897 [Solemya velum]
MVVPPPAYSDAVTEETGQPETESQVQTSNFAFPYGTKLPTYTDATNLPSYEEAEQTKKEEVEKQQDIERQQEMDHNKFTGMTIGTDGIFLCTFFISFLFNWIGFLSSLCLSNTVAGRCGALSGLGLSIVKWVVIVKNNDWAGGFASADSWIWWLLILCGFMIFIRGAVQYARVKYEWQRLTGHLRRYYFF